MDEILTELADLDEKDRKFGHPQSASQVVEVSVEELFEHGKRNERRATLNDELAQLSREEA